MNSSQRGQILILFAIAIPIIIGFAGLALDIGVLLSSRTSQQKAADAAALAAAVSWYADPWATPLQLTDDAKEYAEKNGYGDDATVAVDFPEKCGRQVVKHDKCVGVTITQTETTYLLSVLGIDSGTIKVRGVAAITDVDKNYALIVLNATACKAYNHTSSSDLTLTGGGMIVNSDGSECTGDDVSAYQGGGSVVTAEECYTENEGVQVDCPIEYNKDGGWVTENNATTSPQPLPTNPIPDPLDGLVEPVPCDSPGVPAGCVPASPTSNPQATPSNPKALSIPGNSPVTLQPGTYYGGIKISGSATVTFEPGLYVLAGGCSSSGQCGNDGGLEKTTAAATLLGEGVTFFITRAPNANSPGSRECGAFKLASGGVIEMSAPDDSYVKGPPSVGILGPLDDSPIDASDLNDGAESVLFWQSKTCNPQHSFDFDGNNSVNLAGLIYLPLGTLNLSGSGNIGTTQIIVDTFKFSGTADVWLNYKGYVQATLPKILLAE
ncbi:MAG TPA: pilus assembly protein TadG-related protein [Dehalococcoidia bacterium]|nr:pilus assembly protein TadG-related protein [Dehalococcoidia bacterium]